MPSPKRERKKQTPEELRVRRVTQTLAAFIGGGWIALEFVHWILIAHYHFPERLLDITFVSLMGALLCLLAWRWFRYPAAKPRRVKPELILIPVFIAATLFLDVRLILKMKSGGPAEAKAVAADSTSWLDSIAVLSFADLSPAMDQDYFCEGMAEDIRTKLTRLSSRLKVIARYAMLPFKNTPKPVGDIARDLGVEKILEGSVQKEGDRIRVNAQLINAGTGAHLWADRYDKKVESVFDVQDEISLSIVNALELKLQPGATDFLNTTRPVSVEAWTYSQKGQNIINESYALTGREEDFNRALEMYRKAIDIDPKYGVVYACLAWAYYHHYTFSGKPEDKARFAENARKAVDLDPASPEALNGIGFAYFVKGDLDRAFELYRNALALNPNRMEIVFTIALSLERIGLYYRAIDFYRRTLDLSPGYPFALGSLGWDYLILGDADKGKINNNKVMEISPDHPTFILDSAEFLIRAGNWNGAGRVLERAGRINLGTYKKYLPYYQALLAATQGKKEEALSIDKSPDIYALLGLTDKAIDSLKTRIAANPLDANCRYLILLHNPYLDSIRNDPRFQEILAGQKKIYDDLVKKYGNI